MGNCRGPKKREKRKKIKDDKKMGATRIEEAIIENVKVLKFPLDIFVFIAPVFVPHKGKLQQQILVNLMLVYCL